PTNPRLVGYARHALLGAMRSRAHQGVLIPDALLSGLAHVKAIKIGTQRRKYKGLMSFSVEVSTH
ncbi:MAG: hypothetical protein ABL974_21925, partial [Prosthecobacter sp.]